MNDIKKKSKGPIRLEAVIPVTIIVVAVGVFFTLFFDTLLKGAFEKVGYAVVGAEVNVASVKTSFSHANIDVRGIQITNAEEPTHNSLEIGSIRFGMSWSGLLKARFIIDEMAVEQVALDTTRSHPGKVKPPEPPKPPSNEPSQVEEEAMKLKEQTLKKMQGEYQGNAIGDLAAVLSGGDSSAQLKNIEGTLASKKMADDLQAKFSEKQKYWNEKLKTLPQGKDFQALGEKIKQVKTKDFKTPQELADSLKQLDGILKEADVKFKEIQSQSGELNKDLSDLQKQAQDLQAQVQTDIKTLEARLKLPHLDAVSMTKAIFGHYLDPYTAKFRRYQAMAEKYIPPNLIHKKGQGKNEVEIKPHPREKGVTYEFGRANSLPAFWIKKISLSSKANAEKGFGDMSGKITDVTSNQTLVGKPTVIEFKGDFPSAQMNGLTSKIVIDARSEKSRIDFDLGVAGYLVQNKDFVNSADVQLSLEKAKAHFNFKGELVALHELHVKFNNTMNDVAYKIDAKNSDVKEILNAVFKGIPEITLNGAADGWLPDVAFELNSNVGPALQSGFEKQLSARLEATRAKLKAYVDEQVGQQQKKIQETLAQIKGQAEGEIKKAQDQANAQKAEVQSKEDQAKKDAEAQANKAKKQAEDAIKKQLGPDADKKIDDLKKKFGF